MFERKGQISFAPGVDEEALMDAALEAGADDVVVNDDGLHRRVHHLRRLHFGERGAGRRRIQGDEAEVTMIPSTTATLDLETAQKVLKLIDMLEDLDDVQNVYSNADIPDDVMAQLG
ncbi:YebC/PmpR family DNA-binding transcriptional regulator [Pseudomonas aeruginosa]